MLHNMSCRPSTQVEWTILPDGESLVRFELAAIDWAAGTGPEWRTALDALSSLGPTGGRRHAGGSHDELALTLDDAWKGWTLRGAVHVYPWPAAEVVASAAGLSVFRATHPALVLNVLGRTRSQLLLPAMPLSLERAFLDRELASDDPRLVALAIQTAFVEEC